MQITSTRRHFKSQIPPSRIAPHKAAKPETPEPGDNKQDMFETSIAGAAGGALLLSIPMMLCGFPNGVGEVLANAGLGQTASIWGGLAATAAVGGLAGAAGGMAYSNNVLGNPTSEIQERVTNETFGEPIVGVMGAATTALVLGIAGTNGLPFVGLAAGALLSKNKKVGAAAGLIAGTAAAALAGNMLSGGTSVGPLVNAAASLMVGGVTAGFSRAMLVNNMIEGRTAS